MENLDFKLISDPAVLAVPIVDNGDALLDITNDPKLRIDPRKSKSSSSYSRLRNLVVEKLLKAQSLLPAGLQLLIIEGHRPLTLQKRYFDDYSKELANLHPDWNTDTLYKEASKFVAPPAIIPPHSTGGAVDLTLADSSGHELDMGTRVNADPEESNNACFTVAENISQFSKENRQILIDAMLNAGFVNYPTEWWHWSYGDRYWAYVTKQPHAIFGSVE